MLRTMDQNGNMSRNEEPIEVSTVKDLAEWLQAAPIEWPEGGNCYFFPINEIEKLENDKWVQDVLREIFPDMDRETQASYARSICCSMTKILTILLWGASGAQIEAIVDLVDDKISDRDLPFTRLYTDVMNGSSPQSLANRRYTLGRRDHDNSCQHKHHSTCGIKAFANWKRMDIQNFCRDQWATLSPVFENTRDKISHYDILDSVVLPFIDDQEMVKGAIKVGGYSEVWSTRIHPAHQKFLRSADPSGPLIAIKRLFSRDLLEFEKERAMLCCLTLKGHLHLVKLLSTYKYKGRFHFLCPFANANLRDYWESTPVIRSTTTYLWSLRQMAGVASGLNLIHNFRTAYPLRSDRVDPQVSGKRRSLDVGLNVDPKDEMFGRHGDLKPENILWFNELEGVDEAGILQIADLGLGRFHRLESRSRQDPKHTPGSPTYIPPEIPLEKPVSRAYDIWSLGCIFLEFITWLLEDREGLHKFVQARLAKADDGVYDDTFYMILASDSGRKFGQVREGVTNWIERLRRDHACSEMVQDLLEVVQTRMLRVNSENRIKAEELDLLLKSMLEKAEKGRVNRVYLLGK